jgi:hypothetical protein
MSEWVDEDAVNFEFAQESADIVDGSLCHLDVVAIFYGGEKYDYFFDFVLCFFSLFGYADFFLYWLVNYEVRMQLQNAHEQSGLLAVAPLVKGLVLFGFLFVLFVVFFTQVSTFFVAGVHSGSFHLVC